MEVADEAKRLERRVPRLPFLFDRRVFGGVLFGQGRFAQRDLGREAGEQQNQTSLHVHVDVDLLVLAINAFIKTVANCSTRPAIGSLDITDIGAWPK